MTTTYQAARDGGASVEWILEVAGLTARYYTGPTPPPAKSIPGLAANYEDVPALDVAGDWLEEVDPARGWYQGASVALTLATRGALATTDADPGLVFSALGSAAADNYAQVVSEITAASLTIELDRPWTPASGAIHIGRESITYTNPGGGPPYLLNIVGRGGLASWSQNHYTDDYSGLLPQATDRVVSWLGRPAYLYYAVRHAGAPELSEPALWAPCIISGSPSISGPTVSLSISPATALIQQDVGGALQTPRRVTLLAGVHRFYREAPQSWGAAQSLPNGSLQWRDYSAPGGGTPNVIPMAAYSYPVWASFFASDQPWMVGADITHPRRGHLILDDTSGNFVRAMVSSAAAPNVTTTGLPAGMAGGTWAALEASEFVALDLVAPGVASTDYDWPMGLQGAMWTRFSASATATYDGSWAKVVLDAQGSQYRVTQNCIGNALNDPMRLAFTWVDERPPGGSTSNFAPMWQSLLDTQLDPGRWEDPTNRGEAPRQDDLVSYPIRPTVPPDVTWLGSRGAFPARVNGYSLALRQDARTVPVQIARGWREIGEPFVFSTSDPGLPAGDTPLLVEWVEANGDEKSVVATATGPAVADTVSGVACYRIPLDRPWRVPSFGSWPGQPDCTLTPIISWGATETVPSWRVLLELLESGGSGGTYDVQPWGAGIPSALIDEASFRAFTDPPGLGGWSIELLPDSDLAQLLSSILLVSQTQIIIRRGSDGTARLTRVASGLPTVASTVLDIPQGSGSTLPVNGTSADITNQYKIRVRAGEGEQDEFTWIDQVSVAATNKGGTIELDLRGLYVGPGTEPVVRALQPVLAGLAAAFGSERKTWTLVLPIHTALGLYPGADVTITDRDLTAAKGPPGVTAAVARVQSLSYDLDGATASVVFVYYGARTTALNASSRVTGIPAADQLTLDDDYYTAGVDPLTGEAHSDVADWTAGDVLWLYVEGDPDGGALVTVASITGPVAGAYTLTTAAPHGLASTPAILEPATYDARGPGHATLAYLADATGTLGAAADEAMVYS